MSGLDSNLIIVNNGISAIFSIKGEMTESTPVAVIAPKIDANVSANGVTRAFTIFNQIN